MRQVWGRPFGLIVGCWCPLVGGGGFGSAEVRRMILRCAQNDKGRGGAAHGQSGGESNSSCLKERPTALGMQEGRSWRGAGWR